MAQRLYYKANIDDEQLKEVRDDDVPYLADERKKVPEEEANLVSSRLDNGFHAIAVDIDMPVRVVPSSTEGHCHLYVDSLEIDWNDYRKWLEASARIGLIEEGYVKASKAREMTMLRKPGVKKPEKEVMF